VAFVSRFWIIEVGAFAVQAFLFAASYRYLAPEILAWKNVLVGGGIAAFIWEVMKYLFGLYISSINSFTALYGFIGSVFFLMLWLLYSVIIYLLGGHISVELG